MTQQHKDYLNVRYADYKETINLYFEDDSSIVLCKKSIISVTPKYNPVSYVFTLDIITTRFNVKFDTTDKELVKLLMKRN